MTNSKTINKPSIRFKEFTVEWQKRKLGEIGKTYNGLTGKSKEDFGEGSPFINYLQISNSSEVDLEKCSFVKIGTNERQNVVRAGDIFFTGSSETPGEVGLSSALLISPSVKTYLNSFCFGYRLVNNENRPGFLRYLFRNQHFMKDIFRLAQGSTRFNLSKNELMKATIDLPVRAEQEKIADFLASVDEKIKKLEKKKELFEKYKKGVMQQIFSQKIRFKKSNGSNYPDWEVRYLGDFLTHLSNKNKKEEIKLVLSVNNKKGFIAQSEQFENHRVASKDISNYKIVKKGDFAYNPSRINVGSIVLLENFETGIVSPMYVVFGLSEELNAVFFENILKTHYFKHLIKVGCSGSVRDSLNFEDLAKFKLEFPFIEEQNKIADFLTDLDNKINLIKKELDGANKFKNSLLQQMFI